MRHETNRRDAAQLAVLARSPRGCVWRYLETVGIVKTEKRPEGIVALIPRLADHSPLTTHQTKNPAELPWEVEQRGRNREEAKTNKVDRKTMKIDVKRKAGIFQIGNQSRLDQRLFHNFNLSQEIGTTVSVAIAGDGVAETQPQPPVQPFAARFQARQPRQLR